MTNIEDKRKHLEMIQAVISRMGSNSFVFKGWSVTIIAGLSAYATADSSKDLLIVAALASAIFWFVDAYYLTIERSYVALYNTIVATKPSKISYSMKIPAIRSSHLLKTAFTRPILYGFYGAVLILLAVAYFLI